MKLNEESLMKKVTTVTGREPSAKGGKKGGKKKWSGLFKFILNNVYIIYFGYSLCI